MDAIVETNVKADNYATTLKLRNQISLLVGSEKANIIARTFNSLDKDKKQQLIKYLTNSM